MRVKDSAAELMLLKSRDSVLEVSGWKVFIFLPQNKIWRFVIIFTVTGKFLYTVFRAVYGVPPQFLDIADGTFNAIYCVDVILATLHALMGKVRKLRNGKKRPTIFIILDYISLLPLRFIYDNVVYNMNVKDRWRGYYLNFLEILRIYQIPWSFSNLKSSLHEMRTYLFLTILEVVLYCVILIFFFSCFLFLSYNDAEKAKCIDEYFLCVFDNLTFTFGLLSQIFIKKLQNVDALKNCNLLMIIELVVGYVFLYGYAIPVFLFVLMKHLIKHFKYCRKEVHVKILIEQVIKRKKLKKKVSDYFHEAWAFESCDAEPTLMRVLPFCMKKNIYADIYWEAIRHSYLLNDLSIGCKRSLAVGMRSQFLLPQTKLFEETKDSTYFVYLQSGLLQIMAEENNHASVLSMSAGTVVGEMSFFLKTRSKALVRAAKYSIIQVLPMRHFFQVLADYPKDRERILYKVNLRIRLAKSAYSIKADICTYFSFDRENSKLMEQTKWGNVKWIKGQYRAISNLQKAEKSLNLLHLNAEDYEGLVLELSTQMKHTSVNLCLLNVSDEIVHQEGVVCLKSFPWLMNPQSQFVFIWKKMIVFVALLVLLIYPVFIAWISLAPDWFFVFSWVVSCLFTVDILVQFVTAIKINNNIIQEFATVFAVKFFSLQFLADVASAIPLQCLTRYWRRHCFGTNLCFANALLKVYVLIPAINHWNYSPKPMTVLRTFAKYMFLFIIVVYISASIFYLTGVKCIFFDCGTQDWFSLIEKSRYLPYTYMRPLGIYLSVLKAAMLSVQKPNFSTTYVTKSYFLNWFIFFVIKCFSIAMLGECIAVYVMDLSYDVKHKFRRHFIFQYMGRHKIVGNVRERVMNILEFQWRHDKHNYITRKRKTWNILPNHLRNVIDSEFVLPVLAESRLFQWEDKPFLLDLCKRASPLVLPANSLLLTLGTQTKCLYVIQKGFVQINSFIAGDLNLNLSKAIKAKAGDFFPVIDVFSQTPSAVTAVTVTDCELLSFDLEDVISTMMIHGIFKDFVEAVTDTDLSRLTTAKLGVSEFKSGFSYRKDLNGDAFDDIRYIGVVLRYLLRKRAVDSESRWYKFWEMGRVLNILICLFLWPITFGWFTDSRHQPVIILVLFINEVLLSCVDFYIRFHVAYYNKIGIYVTHTRNTAAHYLATTFVTDLLTFSPNFHLVITIVTRNYDFHWSAIVAHVLLRSISLYRFAGVLEYYRYTLSRARPIFCIFSIILIIHYYLNLLVHFYMKKIQFVDLFFNPTISIAYAGKPYEYYFTVLAVISMVAVRGEIYLHELESTTSHLVVFILVTFCLTLLGQTWCSSHIILLLTTSKKRLIAYHCKMRNLVNYLTRQKAEDSTINLALEHFQHRWLHQYEYDVHQILSELPQTLQEDILYPFYRETLSAVECLSNANEYFYRTLTINIEEVFLKKESVIIFQNEVQANIYFIQSGSCFVDDSRGILYRGAMIGDIKRQGIMKNKITATTNVTLLKIQSYIFFKTLENFYATKMEFLSEVANADDFIPSVYYDPSSSEHQETVLYEKEELECEFVSTREDQSEGRNFAKKKKKWRINPNSNKVKCLRLVFLMVAYVTVNIIPSFIVIRYFIPATLSLIYVLDVLWLAQIILSVYVIGTDDEKASTRNKSKRNPLMWLPIFSRTPYDILSVIPIELLPLAYHRFKMSDDCCYIMCHCYLNRLLRGFYIFHYLKNKGKRLLLRFFVNLAGVLMFKITVTNFLVNINTAHKSRGVFDKKCYKTLDSGQWDFILQCYFGVIHVIFNSGLILMEQTSIYIVSAVLVIYALKFFSDNVLINEILNILYVVYYNKTRQMIKLQQLDKFLLVRDASPIIRKRAKKYSCNLLNYFYEGANPIFLKTAPSSIRTDIMRNLYMSHLSECYAFQSLHDDFLKQLTTRMHLNLFFPGDYITEKGDVDHNMYFIQAGEVYCIEIDPHYKILERVTDVFANGDYFGVLQGILPAYPHTHTRRAKTLTRIIVLNYYKWKDLRLAFPEVFDTVYKRCIQRLAKAEKGNS